MALPITNDFETGTSAATISNANSGGGGATAFDTVSIGAGSVGAYSNAQAAHGTLSGLFSTGTAGNASYVTWAASVGTVTRPSTARSMFSTFCTASAIRLRASR